MKKIISLIVIVGALLSETAYAKVVNLKCITKSIEQDTTYHPEKPDPGKINYYKIDTKSKKQSLTTEDFYFLYSLEPLKENTFIMSSVVINRNDGSFSNEIVEMEQEVTKELSAIEKKYSGINKFKKLVEFHRFWFAGVKNVYPDQYLWRVEKGICSTLEKKI